MGKATSLVVHPVRIVVPLTKPKAFLGLVSEFAEFKELYSLVRLTYYNGNRHRRHHIKFSLYFLYVYVETTTRAYAYLSGKDIQEN
jgi:hypothetical protein